MRILLVVFQQFQTGFTAIVAALVVVPARWESTPFELATLHISLPHPGSDTPLQQRSFCAARWARERG